ncbi:hypothetical protein RZE82_09300 [Mollicutes bacterium LVI A0039]|nr:hypothetical protein RZE82_09300 [Mollicutes bacterium LVI A0039]
MTMTTFNLKHENILIGLENRYNVSEVKYNIITGNFVYVDKNGEKKHIHIDSLINHMKYENLANDELFQLLDRINSSYFPRRIRDSFVEFYEANNLKIPRNIFITHSLVEFHDHEDQIFYLQYEDDFDLMFKQAEKYLK